MNNQTQVQVLAPYWLPDSRCWVFDDERTGLQQEAFVLGASEMITELVKDQKLLPAAKYGFRMVFSHQQLPNTHRVLLRLYEDAGGWWYRQLDNNAECWLCPALFKYFDEAPEHLFVRAESLSLEV